ncbi:ribose-phosphate pyrophosphokinase 1 isoform X1 [Selaginella moellendorffii]|uniref:ribose-phosphate pyrophosphokinase 1 isoform X1 n=1 Tax=Selaginella moellendorffii TaxID=88036 RepID=UPI000D1CA7C3|nr:ribose-phosphate pyrophosphokinase 1 isoform X1 [Selaginella moellendorffii]|eukprot:XP_024515636.1 ribose-phosphate pyrophosphokinase 1 isoform X1 [Selaginella moellendorffii]
MASLVSPSSLSVRLGENYGRRGGRAAALCVSQAGFSINSKDCSSSSFEAELKSVLSQRDILTARGINMPSSRPDNRLKIFSGTANLPLAKEIACYMGLELGKICIKRFADGEIYVQLQESVRGSEVFLVQPTCPPANENLMELLVMIDACRRASAKTITAVIPYFGYARADRKVVTVIQLFLSIYTSCDVFQTQGRESIAAKLVANLLTEAGANRVLACDLHSGQALGYFDIPVDHVYGQPVILDYLASKMISADDFVVVSPDVGGVARARAFAKKLSDAPLAIVDKRRQSHNVSEVMNLIGDVNGKIAVVVDDMIDTAGTIANGAALLRQEGARAVYACCTHGVFSPPAIERLSGGLFEEVIITNTIPVKESFKELTILSVANLLGETIWRVYGDSSVSSIFG